MAIAGADDGADGGEDDADGDDGGDDNYGGDDYDGDGDDGGGAAGGDSVEDGPTAPLMALGSSCLSKPESTSEPPVSLNSMLHSNS